MYLDGIYLFLTRGSNTVALQGGNHSCRWLAFKILSNCGLGYNIYIYICMCFPKVENWHVQTCMPLSPRKLSTRVSAQNGKAEGRDALRNASLVLLDMGVSENRGAEFYGFL